MFYIACELHIKLSLEADPAGRAITRPGTIRASRPDGRAAGPKSGGRLMSRLGTKRHG